MTQSDIFQGFVSYDLDCVLWQVIDNTTEKSKPQKVSAKETGSS